MNPTEQAARLLADVPRSVHNKSTVYILEADAIAALPAASAEDVRAGALKEAASHVFVLLHNTPAYVDARTLRDLVPESILALIPGAKT